MSKIVILGMPRSGSSMVAGIFARHGCWYGRCRDADKLNPTGYYENLDVKEWLIEHCGRRAQMLEPAPYVPGIDRHLDSLNPSEPWIVKCSAMYAPVFQRLDVYRVGIIRGFEGFRDSNLKTGFLDTQDEGRIRDIYRAHLRAMVAAGAMPIHTDDLAAGNFDQIVQVLYACGLEANRVKIAAHVDSEHWHYHSPGAAGTEISAILSESV